MAEVRVDETSEDGRRYTWLRATSPVPEFGDSYKVWLDSYKYDHGGGYWSAADNAGFFGAGQGWVDGDYARGDTYAYVVVAGATQYYDDDSCTASASFVGDVDCGPARVPYLEFPTLP